MHITSITAELIILTLTVLTLASRGESTASSYIFLAASILATLCVAYVNVVGSAKVVSAILASAQRVRDNIVSRVSHARISVQGRSARSSVSTACAISRPASIDAEQRFERNEDAESSHSIAEADLCSRGV